MAEADRSRILNINVGVLGHVDSGKTSLVKALSTSLSTAALDKNPQSQQRGITLDLGFSSFMLPLPSNLKEYESEYDQLQFTLVDCPGHASLIRTIIGGSQIIDMMILVVDANKGIQTQTAECIVIGEITTDKMIIVLNKIDMIPEEERESKLDKVITRIKKVLATTKFHDAPIVLTSAAIGGEKVASIGAATAADIPVSSYGINDLLNLVSDSVTIPKRDVDGPLYFSVDHCFAIKGHGTVLTGTVLSGSVSVNSTVEIPNLQLQRKVKSMQMFKKAVKVAKQGDRVGMCVTNLDPKSIERGVVATPGSITQLSTVLCLVKKVRFFKAPCKSNTKFHVSVGHSTVVANVIFFGALEMATALQEKRRDKALKASNGSHEETVHQSVLNAAFQSSFPDVDMNFESHYQYQEELMGMDGVRYGNEPVQWAVVQFQQPVFCPLGSLVIGSRLDADTTEGYSSSQQCRLSFYGPIRQSLDDTEVERLNIFHWKMKEGAVHKISDVRGGLCTELIGWKMFSEGSSIAPFVGMKVNTERGNMGTIMGPYGSDGKFRVKFEPGIRVSVGSVLRMRFKKFLYDKSRSMEQVGVEEVIDTSIEEPAEDMVVDDGEGKRKKQPRKTVVADNGAAVPAELLIQSPAIPSSPVAAPVPVASGSPLASSLPEPQITLDLAPPGITDSSETASRVGYIESIKAEGTDASAMVMVIRDAFRMEENIKSFTNAVVVGPNAEVGVVTGPFGKLGKVKAKFSFGLSLNTKVGDSVKIRIA